MTKRFVVRGRDLFSSSSWVVGFVYLILLLATCLSFGLSELVSSHGKAKLYLHEFICNQNT